MNEKKKNLIIPQILFGSMTKNDAIQAISRGVHNIHAGKDGEQDENYQLTSVCMANHEIPSYGWEKNTESRELFITESSHRSSFIEQLLKNQKIDQDSHIYHRIKIVLEELLTNGFYHAYKTKDGFDMYIRNHNISLPIEKALKTKFLLHKKGCFIEVIDKGGSLTFEDIKNALLRCLTKKDQIESKESGAGLGIYLIFKTVTHVKIVVSPDKYTSFSVWLSEGRHSKEEYFSFNFFTK